MMWYNWIAIAFICVAGFIWAVIPDKPIWLHAILIGTIIAGVLFVKYMPDKKLTEGE